MQLTTSPCFSFMMCQNIVQTLYFKPIIEFNRCYYKYNEAILVLHGLELLSARPRTISAKWHIAVIPCALVVRLIYTPSALGLQVYISGKPLVPMV